MKTLMVTVDAWRADHASFAPGGRPETTPYLDAFADDAVVFSQAISHGPATPYAFPGIFTSTLPLSHGGYEHLGEGRTLLTESLSSAGWRSSGFHANPWLGEQYGYARGYDVYRDTGEFGLPLLDRGRTFLIDNFGLDHPVYRVAQRAYRYAQKPVRHVTTGGGSTADAALQTVRSMGGDEFVWTHLLAPHAPYDPPKRHREAVDLDSLDGRSSSLVTDAQHDPEDLDATDRAVIEKLYAASVRLADEQVGRLLDAVDDDTLVVITADHGEALFEHGRVGHDPVLFDELVRVPLLVRPPGGTDRRVVETQVQHADLAPTILDYAGKPAPESWRGTSLRPAIEEGRSRGSGAPMESRPVVSEVASTKQTPGRIDADALKVAVRTPERKVVYDAGTVTGYDLAKDPGEVDPVRDPSGQDWRSLRETLDDRLEAISLEGVGRTERDDAVRDRLEDLGYLG